MTLYPLAIQVLYNMSLKSFIILTGKPPALPGDSERFDRVIQ